MKRWIKFDPHATSINATLRLPLSKSISNRQILLYHLHGLTPPPEIISSSRDSKILAANFRSDSPQIDFLDAGTPARFSLCYHAFKGITKIICGNQSLSKRSIEDLVEVLITHGAQIDYLGQIGYFPVQIHRGIDPRTDLNWEIHTRETSQFVSALMLCLSSLELPQKLHVQDLDHSWSYIRLSQFVLEKWGFQVHINNGLIEIGGSLRTPEQPYTEIDWGSASFMFLTALITQKTVRLKGAKKHSSQSDYQIVELFEKLGIRTEFNPETHEAILIPQPNSRFPHHFDGSECPDLIPVLVSACMFKNMEVVFEGIDNLKTKESNRIESIQYHVHSLGWSFQEVQPGQFLLRQETDVLPPKLNIRTFGDHRIAMAFSPWAAVIEEVTIDDIDCVEKSFPQYWEEMKLCNFEVYNSPSRVI